MQTVDVHFSSVLEFLDQAAQLFALPYLQSLLLLPPLPILLGKGMGHTGSLASLYQFGSIISYGRVLFWKYNPINQLSMLRLKKVAWILKNAVAVNF